MEKDFPLVVPEIGPHVFCVLMLEAQDLGPATLDSNLISIMLWCGFRQDIYLLFDIQRQPFHL